MNNIEFVLLHEELDVSDIRKRLYDLCLFELPSTAMNLLTKYFHEYHGGVRSIEIYPSFIKENDKTEIIIDCRGKK